MESIFPKVPEASAYFSGKVASTLFDLSEDLRSIFEKQINCDLTLHVGNKTIKCHKAILSARSKWFEFRIEQLSVDGSSSIILNEKEQTIMDALMVYIYTGNLRLVESLKVPILDLHDGATQYGMHRFKKLLTRMIKTEQMAKPTKTRNFAWKLKISDCKTKISMLPLEGFSIDGSDTWSLKVRPLCFSKVKYAFWVYVKKKSVERKANVIYVASLEICILGSSGKIRKSFVSDHIFREDAESKMSEHLSLCKLLQSSDDLLPDGVLSLTGNLSITSEDLSSQRTLFEIKDAHEGGVTNELHGLSHDMYKLLKASKYADVGILIKGSLTFVARVHSYILHGRSMIPIFCIGNLIDHGINGSILWKSFIYFIYTGQPRYLEDHMRQVYAVACKMSLIKTRKKYSTILTNHLTMSNVFDILNEAIAYEDTELIFSGMAFMADNDHLKWNEFANKHPPWAREVMKATRRKKPKLDD